MIGVISSLLYSRAMVTVAQGTLKKIRDDMFEKMLDEQMTGKDEKNVES